MRCLIFTLTLMAMFLMFMYTAAMKSFLAVKRLNLVIRSAEDILESPIRVLVDDGYSPEEHLRESPKGSIRGKE